MPPANNNFITDGLHSHNLEPRVARLETGLEILTKDVSNLVVVVRDQSRNIEDEIQKLAVAVTQASAPKKTEWSTLIATVMLIMALGSTAFIPLRQMEIENKERLQALVVKFEQHTSQPSHPVIAQELESFRAHCEIISEQIKAKLNKLESNNDERNKADLDELREIKKRVVAYHMGPMPYTVVTNR